MKQAAGQLDIAFSGVKEYHPLTYDDVDKLPEAMLNPSVEPPDEERLAFNFRRLYGLFVSRQNLTEIYPEALPVSTAELMEYAKAQYNARLKELRRALIELGWCIDCVGSKAGTHYYKLVPLGESTYYAKRKHKL